MYCDLCCCYVSMVTGNRKDIGLEKFFKSSLLSSLKRKNLRTMVLHVRIVQQ